MPAAMYAQIYCVVVTPQSTSVHRFYLLELVGMCHQATLLGESAHCLALLYNKLPYVFKLFRYYLLAAAYMTMCTILLCLTPVKNVTLLLKTVHQVQYLSAN